VASAASRIRNHESRITNHASGGSPQVVFATCHKNYCNHHGESVGNDKTFTEFGIELDKNFAPAEHAEKEQ
jgi:hypothetical protein